MCQHGHTEAQRSVESLSRSLACAKAKAPSRSGKVSMTLQTGAILKWCHAACAIITASYYMKAAGFSHPEASGIWAIKAEHMQYSLC